MLAVSLCMDSEHCTPLWMQNGVQARVLCASKSKCQAFSFFPSKCWCAGYGRGNAFLSMGYSAQPVRPPMLPHPMAPLPPPPSSSFLPAS